MTKHVGAPLPNLIHVLIALSASVTIGLTASIGHAFVPLAIVFGWSEAGNV